MARFVQIIEFQTSRIEEIEQLGRPSRTEGTTAPTFRRIMATADRDRPGTYLTIVEFDSYDAARAYYHSAEYQAARALREGAAEVEMVLVEGT